MRSGCEKCCQYFSECFCKICKNEKVACVCMGDEEVLMEWIKFIEKFPKNNQLIKVKSENLWHGEGIFQDGKFVYSWIKGACFGNPTHWMSLDEQKKG